MLTTPGGTVLTGRNAINETFIAIDIDNMDHVENLSGFNKSDGRLTWRQEWHGTDGHHFPNNCVVIIEDGKIVSWEFN